jgi:hypothetical protein
MQWPPSTIVKRAEGPPRARTTIPMSASKKHTVADSSSSSALLFWVERTPPRLPRRSSRCQSRRRTNSKADACRSRTRPLQRRGGRQLLSQGQPSSSDAGLPALVLLDRGAMDLFSSEARQKHWLSFGHTSRHNRGILSLSPIPTCPIENARVQRAATAPASST